MSVIQKIQDKYGKVMAIIIGLSLVIFIVMLAFENGGSLFRGNSFNVGKVNGQDIEIKDFQGLVEQQSKMLESRGMTNGEALNQQASEMAWNQKVAQILLTQETDKLGITIGKKEMNDLLFGANPPQELKQSFTDPKTGRYDAAMAQQQINQIKSKGTAEQKAQINSFLEQVVFQRLAEKYDALLTNSINFPNWLMKKQVAESGLISKASFVRAPYTSIPDSSITVLKSDIESYIGKHKNDFKQTESRSISYVAFSALPTAADSNFAYQKMLEVKAAFDSSKNISEFMLNQGVSDYYDGYISAKRIQVPMKDSIFRVGAGKVYGPYIDGNNYSLAKVLGSRNIADTVKIRHILIGMVQQDPQTGQQIPIRDSATAKKLADSIGMAIRNGSNFDSLVVKFSNDPGSVQNGGVYENVVSGQMVPTFNDFIFGNPVGTKGVVKTNFGYHYIEILSQKGGGPGYKIAYVSKPIDASPETDMAANNSANKFTSEATNEKSFNAAAEKLQKEKGINKALAADIAPNAYMIQGLGESRSFVKSLYKADLGDVVSEKVGDYYVVALLTEVNKEGTMSADKAKMMVEPILKNKKKAEIITKKIGTITTLEAVANNLKQPIEIADSISFFGGGNPVLGFEPKVIGAAFNKGNVGKVVSEPIPGTQGVYVVKVDNIMSRPMPNQDIEELRKKRYQETKQQAAFQSIQALKDGAKITDDRSKFY